MILDSYGTVSDIEIVWVGLASVGVGFTLYNMISAYKDMRYLMGLKLPPNGRRDLAVSTVLVEAMRLICLLIFIAIGIAAMTLPEIPPDLQIPTNQLVIGILIRWGLILASILIILQSILNAAIRRRSKVRIETRERMKEQNE